MWATIKGDKDEDDKHLPETARYVCEHCQDEIKESDKSRLLLGGEWRATESQMVLQGFGSMNFIARGLVGLIWSVPSWKRRNILKRLKFLQIPHSQKVGRSKGTRLKLILY